MKATGIVRRIDDLGRVVIPKEIRRTLHIKEGDPLEIYTAKDGEVIFKKYSPVGDMGQFAEEYCATLQTVSGFPCAITDKEMVIAAAGKSKTVGKALTSEFEQLLERRRPYQSGGEGLELIANGDSEVALAHPIMAEGDIAGMVTMLATPGKEAGEAENKLLHAAAIFLGKQLES